MGVAVKVTDVPAQTGFAEGDIERLTGRFGFTAIVMVLDAAGLLVVQLVFEEVSTQLTTSLSNGE
jgi:hypothetical protein